MRQRSSQLPPLSISNHISCARTATPGVLVGAMSWEQSISDLRRFVAEEPSREFSFARRGVVEKRGSDERPYESIQLGSGYPANPKLAKEVAGAVADAVKKTLAQVGIDQSEALIGNAEFPRPLASSVTVPSDASASLVTAGAARASFTSAPTATSTATQVKIERNNVKDAIPALSTTAHESVHGKPKGNKARVRVVSLIVWEPF